MPTFSVMATVTEEDDIKNPQSCQEQIQTHRLNHSSHLQHGIRALGLLSYSFLLLSFLLVICFVSMGDSLPSDGSTTPTTIGTASASAERVVLDTSHPFFLHASDSPGMILVSTIFDGKGYSGWRRGILIALSAKTKVSFIDGSIIPPSITSESHRSWSRCNNMVISWLLNSLSKEIAESVLYSKTAKHIWEELEERFGQSNGPLLYQLSDPPICGFGAADSEVSMAWASVTVWSVETSMAARPFLFLFLFFAIPMRTRKWKDFFYCSTCHFLSYMGCAT